MKASVLSKNTNAVKRAQAKVKALASSRSSRSSCGEVISFSSQLTVLAVNNPSSPNVLVIAMKISSYKSVTCSDQEKLSLIDVNTAFEQALTSLKDALKAVQDQLLGETMGVYSTMNTRPKTATSGLKLEKSEIG